VTCCASNTSGFLLLSGGRDGKICIWQWGMDQFLHQVRIEIFYDIALEIFKLVLAGKCSKESHRFFLCLEIYLF
jgi:hypothetical protein